MSDFRFCSVQRALGHAELHWNTMGNTVNQWLKGQSYSGAIMFCMGPFELVSREKHFKQNASMVFKHFHEFTDSLTHSMPVPLPHSKLIEYFRKIEFVLSSHVQKWCTGRQSTRKLDHIHVRWIHRLDFLENDKLIYCETTGQVSYGLNCI